MSPFGAAWLLGVGLGGGGLRNGLLTVGILGSGLQSVAVIGEGGDNITGPPDLGVPAGLNWRDSGIRIFYETIENQLHVGQTA